MGKPVYRCAVVLAPTVDGGYVLGEQEMEVQLSSHRGEE
jgi:hypothetical protein